MSNQKGATVIVVGGGVSGLSAAWWLARSGVDVLVLDKGIVGWEASGRNGGGASHFQSPLFQEEQRLWPLMDEMLGYSTEYQRGKLVLATTEGQLKHYRYMAETFTENGSPAHEIDLKEIHERVPMSGDNILGGVHLTIAGQANPQRTVQGYAWAIQDLGGRIQQHTPVLRLVTTGGKVTGVETRDGILGCDSVVVAAGPQSGALLADIGIDLPLASARAEMIVTEPAPMMAIGAVDGNGLYGRQTKRGNLAYGGGPHEWLEVGPTGPSVRPGSPLVRNITKRLLGLFSKAGTLRVIRSWAGVIENTPDGRPVIDRIDNVTMITMSGVGFGLSPASGHAVRDLVMEGQCSFADIERLKLSRFADLSPTWREEQGWVTQAAPV